MLDLSKLSVNIFDIFNNRWAVLAGGTPDKWNCMTISWGQMGTIWGNAGVGRNIITVFVKPIRYTWNFLNASDTFTVNFFKPEQRKALGILGTRSGRDGDKVAAAGLTPENFGTGVSFAESDLAFCCRKIYAAPLNRLNMPAEVIAQYYATEETHTAFIGEITDVKER